MSVFISIKKVWYRINTMFLCLRVKTHQIYDYIWVLIDKKRLVEGIPDEAFSRIHPDLMKILREEKKNGSIIEYRKPFYNDAFGDMPESIYVSHLLSWKGFYNLETGELVLDMFS